MALRREYVRLLSVRVVDELQKQEMIGVPEGLDLAEQVFQVMDAEVSLEHRIDDEVRSLLNQYQDQMRQSGASYQEMFKLIKNKVVKERKLVLEVMRLTREKVNLLSHQITDKLASIDEVEFIEDRNTIRLAVVDILIKWLKKEEEVDKAARQKIESQK